MSKSLSSLIEKLGFLVNDGGMATQLEALGCDLNDPLWSAKVLVEAPSLIKKVHLSYLEAGANLCTSASYQATLPGLLKKGFSLLEAENAIKLSVILAKEACEEWWHFSPHEDRTYPLVGGSIGPYGAYLADGSEYRGHYGLSVEELKAFHRRRMELLLEAGSDFLAMETIPSLSEAIALAQLADEMGAECWIAFSCRNGSENCEGTPIRECAKALIPFECVTAIGVNCTPPWFVESLIKEIRLFCDLPICVYPNSGETYDPKTKTWHGSPYGRAFSEYVDEWLDAGANIIGGCCRTTPSDIRDVSRIIQGRRKRLSFSSPSP